VCRKLLMNRDVRLGQAGMNDDAAGRMQRVLVSGSWATGPAAAISSYPGSSLSLSATAVTISLSSSVKSIVSGTIAVRLSPASR
jgi:hypothetical protein